MEPFAAHLDRRGDHITVFLRGELDLATAPTLEEVLAGVTGRIRFDCAGLTFLDSSGLAIFSRVDRNGGAALCNVTTHIRRVLEVAAMGDLIEEPEERSLDPA